jgi:predicted NUDIX family NTP pyrophosphohydrolase
MKQSAGTLLYRFTAEDTEVLLVHPSGNYNRHAPWSIPKGLANSNEQLEETARRETLEETGVMAAELEPIGSIDYQKSRKRVHCFSGEAPADAAPRCADDEVDHAEFVAISRARCLIHPDQVPFLERLEQLLHLR